MCLACAVLHDTADRDLLVPCIACMNYGACSSAACAECRAERPALQSLHGRYSKSSKSSLSVDVEGRITGRRPSLAAASLPWRQDAFLSPCEWEHARAVQISSHPTHHPHAMCPSGNLYSTFCKFIHPRIQALGVGNYGGLSEHRLYLHHNPKPNDCFVRRQCGRQKRLDRALTYPRREHGRSGMARGRHGNLKTSC